jgi:HlyD family secretion protein
VKLPIGRRTLALVLALVVAIGGYAIWRHLRDGDEPSYVTEKVDQGRIAATVTATGTVNPVKTVQVGTYVSGPIIALDVDYNSPVKKGQRVAKIDPAPFESKVLQAEANLANAKAQVQKAQADLALKKLTYERNKELRGRNLIAQGDLDAAHSAYQQAVAQLALDEAGVKQATASLQDARISLGYTDIVSPVDGVVVSRNVDVGQTVAASFQTPTLFLIAQDLTKMQVDSNVSESDIGSVHEGQAASFTVDAYPGRTFHGRVAQVRNAPITVQNVVTYDVVVAVDNEDLALKPGMTATVTITTAERDDALRIPLRALRFDPTRAEVTTTPPSAAPAHPRPEASPAVWVLDPDGRLRRVEIQTGLRDDDHAEVTGGDLRAGQAVAVAFQRATSRPETPRSPFGRRLH